MAIELSWMRPDAPYMPIATVGLLSALEDAGCEATARWHYGRGGAPGLLVETDLSVPEVAQAVVDAPWPDINAIPWSGKVGQAIKPMLAAADDPVGELKRLRRFVDDAGLIAEGRLLRSFVTEAVLDGGAPSRSRLLRGVKSDLSGIADKVKLDPAVIQTEIENGPLWQKGTSGRGLGLVPEIQTFGGTTGPNPSDIGSYSALLYRLLWLGILALPPVAVVERGRRIVGGPLVADRETISWPVWTIPLNVTGLRAYFSLAGIHAERTDLDFAQRGIAAVYRADAVPINTTVAVFRWGKRVA